MNKKDLLVLPQKFGILSKLRRLGFEVGYIGILSKLPDRDAFCKYFHRNFALGAKNKKALHWVTSSQFDEQRLVFTFF